MIPLGYNYTSSLVKRAIGAIFLSFHTVLLVLEELILNFRVDILIEIISWQGL